MASNNIFNDLASKYVEEVLKPQLGKGGDSAPKKPEGGQSSDSGEEGSAKRVRQAVYDIRYRARREDVPLEQAFSQYMGNTSMNAVEKKEVKEKLGIGPGGGGGASSAPKSANEEVEIFEEDGVKKFQVRVTDKLTGKSYVRMATREKINQLRANKNIGSVEMTKYGSPYEGEKKKGEQTASVTSGKGLAKKDYDGDGKVESGAKEYRGAVHNAIQRKKGGKPDGKDTSTVKEATSKDIEVPSKDLAKLAKKAAKRIDTNVSGDVNKKDKSMGDFGEFIPSVDGKKKVTTKIGESFSDWRMELSEVIDDDIASKKKDQVKEKKINNYSGKGKCIQIEPKLSESIKEIGGQILEVTEIISEEDQHLSDNILNIFEGIDAEDFFFMDDDLIEDAVSEVFFESIQEGYTYSEVEESILLAIDDYLLNLNEGDYYDSAVKTSKQNAKKIAAKKRAEKIAKVKDSVKKVASDFKSGAKKAIKGTAYRVGSAAKGAYKGASRAAGYAAGTAKKAVDTAKSEFKKGYEKGSSSNSSSDSDSESSSGSSGSSGSYRIKYKSASGKEKREGMFSKLKRGLKKAVGKTARAVSKGADKVASKLGEETIDEKITAKTDMGAAIKDFYASKSPQLAGRTKEERRKAAIAAVLTARRGGKKLGEAVSQISGRENNPPEETTAKQDDVQKKQMLANKKKMMMKQQMLQKQRLQMQQQGKLPMGHAAEEIEYDLEEGMSMKDFKANRKKLKRRESSADAKKRGHVGKEWYNSGQTYSPDQAKRMRSKLDDEERMTRKRSAIDPDDEDLNYSADKTKNPKKIRKQKAMGELGEAVYGGEKKEPKDTRYTVTAADKKGNTPAYQKYKAGDKRYKAADHLGEEMIDELNRAEKETGIDTKTGKPTQSGGAKDDKAFTHVKRMMRGMEGKPAGQRKKVPGKKPPVAGQFGAPRSPAQKVAAKRAAAKRAQDNMSSRFD